MSFTWKLQSNDLVIKGGTLQTVYGVEEIKQRLLIALRHYFEEYFLNVPDGVPWYEYILGTKDKKTVELILRSKILEVPGVVGIANFYMYRNELRDWVIEITVEVADIQSSQQIYFPIYLSYDSTSSSPAIGNEFANINIEFGNNNWIFGI